MINVAVCVLTYNEERNISHCLKAISKYFENINIVDSGSSDKTKSICEKFNVDFYEHRQEGCYSAAIQRNWAMENIENSTDWFLFIDADEIIDDNFYKGFISLKEEFLCDVDVVSIPLIYYFHGRKIKSMGYPNWHDRIIKRNVRFRSSVGEYIPTSKRLQLPTCEIKHNFNSLGMRRFIEKQSRYAEFIGKETYRYLNGEDVEYFNKTSTNTTLKKIAVKFGIFRPCVRFVYQYIYKRGFLEGKEGFLIASYMAVFELLIVIAYYEQIRVKNKEIL